MKKRPQKFNKWRFLIQWSILGYLLFLGIRSFLDPGVGTDFEAYCPFGGIQSLGSFLVSGSLACSMTSTQIAMGMMLIVGILLFSKLFCAYVCPVGTISEWLGGIGARYKIRIAVPETLDRLFRLLKYLLLFLTFYFTIESNELFCKKYDPFYAVATGFSMDVVWWYALITISIVVIGSLLFNLFWCKYLCPLGAISNIIKFSWFFAAVLVVYLVIHQFILPVSYVWPLAIGAIGGYYLEIRGERLNFSAIAKITRNETTCTGCQLCNRKCPQMIDVAHLKVVNKVDCNLCGECLEVCPEKDTLQINRKSNLKLMLPLATILLFMLGLNLSSQWEIPTIDQRWGTEEQIKQAGIFTQSGLTAIKCYGSSMAFAAKMKEVKGVYGVSTYVTSHTVKVYYDKALLNDQKIQAEIFVPQRAQLRPIPEGSQHVETVTLQLENFFDTSDFGHLQLLLKEKSEAVGVESSFSCPVMVKIYFAENKSLSISQLTELLENKQLLPGSDQNQEKIELKFKVVGQPVVGKTTAKEYLFHMFETYQHTFNWKPAFDKAILDTLQMPLRSANYDPEALPYFSSHLSNDDGVVGLRTRMDQENVIYFQVIFVDSLTNASKIIKNMQNDTMTVNYEGGEIGKIKNSFKF